MMFRGSTPVSSETPEGRFNRLYEEHVEAVRRYIWRRDPSLCEDVLAETFLTAWRRLDAIPEHARPWLIGVARNVRLNMRRSARRQQVLAQRLVERPTADALPTQAREEADFVRAAVLRLSEGDREVLLLSIWDELDRGAIAQVLGCSKPNVSVRLHRARRRLEAALAQQTSDELSRRPLHSGGPSSAC